MYDVVTFGEAMVRLSPPDYKRLEQTSSLDVNCGGGEYNVAVSCARLGLRSAWVSRLTANPLGRMVANKAREHGVDVSHLKWVDGDRVGLYFLELGATPRASRVYYDRAHSAISRIQAGDIDWSLLRDTRLFHVSGITPALGEACAAQTAIALQAARQYGRATTFDLNYRKTLWTQDQARACMEPMMEHVEVLITTEDDTRLVFGMEGEPPQIAEKLAQTFGFKAVAITIRTATRVWLGQWTAIVYADKLYTDKTYDVEIVDRVGSGDAFSAGFIFGYLEGDLQKALEYGNAMSVIKHSHPGDLCFATEDEVKAQVAGGGAKIVR